MPEKHAAPPKVSVDTVLTFKTWVFDVVIWIFSSIFDLFFREITTRGSYKVPRNGPIILVAGPHANQFVDGILVMHQVRKQAGRRVSFLMADASLKRKFVGAVGRASLAIGVVRPQDNLKPAVGTISVDFEKAPLVVKGKGTKFTQQAMERGLLGLPKSVGNAEIAEIRSDTEILLRKEFKGAKARNLLEAGTEYKTAEHVNQSQVFHRVFDSLNEGACVGIFPEGGSHDRSDLLPLKAGVAIMALGALEQYPDCGVKIVPCGMNYFHPNKFRSRAVIEFGNPITISPELVELYKTGGESKRQAVAALLDNVTDALKAVTVNSPDWETHMMIQAARRLYRPAGRKIPLPLVVELNRRLLDGYMQYKDRPAIVELKDNVAKYNQTLKSMGIQDHQVETASLSTLTILGRILARTLKLVALAIPALPGTIMFLPIFAATRHISQKKAAEALKGSTVKIQAKDVIATWKLLVAMGLAPLVYFLYSILFVSIASWYNILPNVSRILLVFACFPLVCLVSYSALVLGETGMDIFKSLPPLFMALSPTHQNSLAELQAERRALVLEITDIVQSLGPSLYPTFVGSDLIADSGTSDTSGTKESDYEDWVDRAAAAEADPTDTDPEMDHAKAPGVNGSAANGRRRRALSTDSQALSRVNSASSLANMPLFSYASSDGDSSSPRSRSGSDASASSAKGTSTATKGTFESDVSRRIRGTMAERAKQRQKEAEED